MKRLLLLIAVMLSMATAIAQQPNIILEMKEGKIFAARSGYGTFTVELSATTDYGVQRQYYIIRQDTQQLELLGNPAVHSFRWNWLQGAVDSGVDTAFIYKLPYHGCQRAAVHSLNSADVRIYRGNFQNFRIWQFDVRRGTKIYPMRSGEVIAVGQQSVTIEHADGSQAEYSVLNEAMQVAEGEQVTTKTQLGTADELDGKNMVRVAVYFYTANTSKMHPSMFSQTVYINPVFHRGHLKDGKRY